MWNHQKFKTTFIFLLLWKTWNRQTVFITQNNVCLLKRFAVPDNPLFFQDIFIRAIFAKPRLSALTSEGREDYDGTPSEVTLASLHHAHYNTESVDGDLMQPVRIIHKEQDSILAFCLNRVKVLSIFYFFLIHILFVLIYLLTYLI